MFEYSKKDPNYLERALYIIGPQMQNLALSCLYAGSMAIGFRAIANTVFESNSDLARSIVSPDEVIRPLIFYLSLLTVDKGSRKLGIVSDSNRRYLPFAIVFGLSLGWEWIERLIKIHEMSGNFFSPTALGTVEDFLMDILTFLGYQGMFPPFKYLRDLIDRKL